MSNFIMNGSIRVGIAYQRPLPTNQTISYAMYDEAWHLAAGTYDYTPPSNPVWMAELDTTAIEPILTLKNNNEYGNKDRFTDIDGLQVYADNYVIDHLTGLGWDITLQPNQLWNQHLIDAEANTMLGYSDFRVPTSTEGVTLFNYGVTTRNAMLYPPFNVNDNKLLASSSVGVYQPQGIKFMAISAIWGHLEFNTNIAISNVYGMYCRNHYVDSNVPEPIVPVIEGIAYNRDFHTFQTTSYALYDDAWQLANGSYDNYTQPEFPIYTQRLDLDTDPTGYTLLFDNYWGNKIRFTDESGVASTDIHGTRIIDNFTGLQHSADAVTFAGTFDQMFGTGGKLETANNNNYLGYNDWFAANIKMIFNLFTYSPTSTSLLPWWRTTTVNMATSTALLSVANNSWRYAMAGLPTASNNTTYTNQYLATRIYFK